MSLVTKMRLTPLLLSGLMLPGCTNDGTPSRSIPDNELAARHMGSGRVVMAADVFEGVPDRVQAVDGLLLVVDNLAPHKLVIADTAGRILDRIIGPGDGPQEADFIRNVGVFRDTIYAWASGSQRLLLKPLKGDTIMPRRALTQAGEPRFAIPDFDGTTVLVGIMGDNMYARSVGDSAYPVGSAPELLLNSSDNELTRWGWSFAGGVARHPFLRMLAIGYRDAGQMTIVKVDNGKELYSHRPFDWDLPEARTSSRGQPILGSGTDLKLGFIDVAADSLYVFGLFANRAENEISFDLPPIGNDVYVYDWMAQPLTVLRFEHPISSISYSGGYLYAIEWREDVPALKRWSIDLPTAVAACPPWDRTFPTRTLPPA